MTNKEKLKKIEDHAREIWALAQLLPNEGIEDGVDRITKFLLEEDFVKDICSEVEEEKVKVFCERCGSDDDVREVVGQGYGVFLCKKCDPYHVEVNLDFIDDFFNKKT